MDPITQSFDGSKNQIMNAFSAALEEVDLLLHGRKDRLGMLSIQQKNKPMLYAHVVEQSNGTTEVSMAPGKAYLKDRNNSERPDATIRRIMKQVESVISNNK